MKHDSINASGADGSGTSVLIYSTPDYEYDRSGASVNHGSFEMTSVAEPRVATDISDRNGHRDGDRSRVEVVEIGAPHVHFRVRASDVRREFNELRAVLRRTAEALASSASQESRERARAAGEEEALRAFHALFKAVLRASDGFVTLDHFQEISRKSFRDGADHGEHMLRMQLRALLGI